MKDLFFPFGAQYYRYPTPLREDWEQDIKNISETGFNTIKIWAQWRVNEPQKGVYDFSDLDELMDISHKYGLKVIINIILDVTPLWFAREFPDSHMVCKDGEILYPQTTLYRQVGGAPGPCYHHPDANKYKYAFVEALAERFKNHPVLYLYDLWNEPELTCGIYRKASLSKMTCYCSHSEREFKRWLENKYKNIEALNLRWRGLYKSFDEIELPRDTGKFTDMIDWRTFFADTLLEDLNRRIAAVRRHDEKTPLMLHTVPPPYFNMLNACADDYKMAKPCDMFGNSIGSEAFPATLSMSCAQGKPVISSEIHTMSGETLNHPCLVTYEDFKSHIFTPLSCGVKGFLFWQYRPELLGKESPAWGLSDLKGNSTKHLESAAKIWSLMQKNRDIVFGAMPPPAMVAVIRDNANEIFTYCASKCGEKYYNDLIGAFNFFDDSNIPCDIITTEQLMEIELDKYKVLYYPMPYMMSSKIADRLREWINDGGMLISESLFGGYDGDIGLHSRKIPGFGFDEVFSAEEKRCISASRFLNAYGEQWSKPAGELGDDFEYESRCGGMCLVPTFLFNEVITPKGARAIGKYPDGRCAVVSGEYGKGCAIWIGTMLGAAYNATHSGQIREMIKDMVAGAGIYPTAVCVGDSLRVRVLGCDSGQMIIIENKGQMQLETDLRFAKGLLSGEYFEMENDDAVAYNGDVMQIKIAPKDTLVILSGNAPN